MFEDPKRKERWDFITESLPAYCKGVTRTDPEAIRNKRWMVENLCDTALRTITTGEGAEMVLDRSAINPLYEHVVEGKDVLFEDTTIGWTTPGTVPNTAKVFTTQSLGMVRRVFPRMIATDLISVQPLSQPTGKVFYLDIKYGTAGAGGVAVGDRVDDPSAWTQAGQRDFASFVDTGGTNATSAIGEGTTARELNLDLSSIDVTTESKKLAAEWSVESQQDLRAYHGLDADGELTAATAQEITREIDRTLIYFLLNETLTNGAGITYWNKSGAGSTLPTEIKAWEETLFDAIEDAASDIETARYRRPTWLLANADTCARIRKLNSFKTMNVGDNGTDLQISTGGRRILGTLQDTFYVYSDPWFIDPSLN
jgi:hypothetical protein